MKQESRKQYDAAFKREAVRLASEPGVRIGLLNGTLACTREQFDTGVMSLKRNLSEHFPELDTAVMLNYERCARNWNVLNGIGIS